MPIKTPRDTVRIVGFYELHAHLTAGDTIGMDMVNKGCEAAVREIQRRFVQARLVTLTGNGKTPPWTEGQGKSVVVRTSDIIT